MANDTGTAAPVTNTPPRNSGLPTELKSTPHAVGSAVVSEHIDTLGVNVDDVHPWIGRDVKNYAKCGADEMLQQLLEMCTSQSLPPSQKSTLFDTSLEAVLHLCNGPGQAQTIKKHLTKFCNRTGENPSYTDFVQAANWALRGLEKVNVPGIPVFKDDDTKILFHVNDPSLIHQKHQGKTSIRKPDVVVVSYESARDAMLEGQSDIRICVQKPAEENFQWTNVRTTFEFKRPQKHLPRPPSTYNKDYVVPTVMYMNFMEETNPPAEPTDSTPATGPTRTSYNKSNQLQNISDRLRSNKRGSDHLGSSEPPNLKRSKQDEERESRQEEGGGTGGGRTGGGRIRRRRRNNIIYIWWFDRQHTIQCAGINFIQDLPRFMVLLFIMQRMGYEQWGLHPLFEPKPGYKGEINVECEEDKEGQDKMKKSKKKRIVDLTLDFNSNERTTHFGLRGRATTLFPVKSRALSAQPRQPHFLNESTELVAKLFWPEEARQSEPEILEEVYKIAKEDPDVSGHVPEMVWFHKFEGTSTAIIRKALGIDDTGSRVLYIIVFRKLYPITTLSGEEFLLAWWEVVKCHRALWKRGVHHRDISPSNIMGYRLRGRFMSVLNDFDLSSIKQFLSSAKNGPQGFERTGTVPFMSLHLLVPEAIAGQVEHMYYHDAESFIWVLTWICLRYDNGKLLRKNRPLDDWLTVDAMGCHEKKLVILKYINPFESIPADDVVFNTWLQKHVPENVLQGNIS
ncbi:hypothetical protein BDR07DRAFT_1405681 [Suillus spraguei]|nr:hypothetical protein BDR07DRAFT_1405681 [Suillus spraguei]